MKKKKKITMEMVLNDPAYRGFHVIVAGGELFKAKTGERASKLLREARKKHPHEIPAITYIPDADTLIYGIGGAERVFFFQKLKVRLGPWERFIPVGFLERNEIPPLMGRHLFMERFETLFSSSHTVTFSMT